MNHTDATSATPVRITGWDRAAIVTLGAAGCALSYDALQQMAVAIHIRGILTFLFPLVIDGFIGYGVRAVLVMRSASLGARCYVWALFGTATAASIWANALHAVRLNDRPGDGALRLGDVTVGVLSTLAPLALAGAVHLYILIARRAGQPGHPHADTTDTATVRVERGAPAVPADSRSGQRAADSPDTVRPVTGPQPSVLSDRVGSRPAGSASDDRSGQPVTDPDTAAKSDARPGHSARAGTRHPDWPVDHGEVSATDTSVAGEVEDLLPLARRAVADAGKLTRAVVADAVRGQGLSISNRRLTELMHQLRGEADTRTLRSTG